MRRSSEAFRRAVDRRQRQDEARRLIDAVPKLAALELDVRERRLHIPGHEVHHKRVIVVDRAPALFEFACADRSCEEGGHDLTSMVLHELSAGKTKFTGTHRCGGHARHVPCEYELTFVAEARYRNDAAVH